MCLGSLIGAEEEDGDEDGEPAEHEQRPRHGGHPRDRPEHGDGPEGEAEADERARAGPLQKPVDLVLREQADGRDREREHLPTDPQGDHDDEGADEGRQDALGEVRHRAG